MMFDDSCRNHWVFSSIHLVGVRVDGNKGSALLGNLLCVYRFPVNNSLIVTTSRPKDRLRDQALLSCG